MSFLKPGPLNMSQRFQRALLFSVPIAIVIGILHFIVRRMLGGFELSLVYMIVGYLIALSLQYVSHGSGQKFRLLAVGVYILALLVSDVFIPAIVYHIDVIAYLQSYFRQLLDSGSLVSSAFKVVGALVAYFSLN